MSVERLSLMGALAGPVGKATDDNRGSCRDGRPCWIADAGGKIRHSELRPEAPTKSP